MASTLENIRSFLETIAGSITNAIMNVKLTANSGVDIGDVDVTNVAVPSSVASGKKTISNAGTDEVLASTTTLVIGVTIKAEASNTGIMYIGTEGVSSADGFELAAGEQIFIPTDNLANVWMDTSVNGDGVTFIYN